MSRINHIAFSVPSSKYAEVLAFYVAALAPIGYIKSADFGVAAGFGPKDQYADFWMNGKAENEPPKGQMHLAFEGKSHKEVQEFYEAALKAGGEGNGEPGVRENWWHGHYYAAFVLDPMGNNLEVVCHVDA